MKTKEELNSLKEEINTLNEKHSALSDRELEQVVGGVNNPGTKDVSRYEKTDDIVDVVR